MGSAGESSIPETFGLLCKLIERSMAQPCVSTHCTGTPSCCFSLELTGLPANLLFWPSIAGDHVDAAVHRLNRVWATSPRIDCAKSRLIDLRTGGLR